MDKQFFKMKTRFEHSEHIVKKVFEIAEKHDLHKKLRNCKMFFSNNDETTLNVEFDQYFLVIGVLNGGCEISILHPELHISPDTFLKNALFFKDIKDNRDEIFSKADEFLIDNI